MVIKDKRKRLTKVAQDDLLMVVEQNCQCSLIGKQKPEGLPKGSWRSSDEKSRKRAGRGTGGVLVRRAGRGVGGVLVRRAGRGTGGVLMRYTGALGEVLAEKRKGGAFEERGNGYGKKSEENDMAFYGDFVSDCVCCFCFWNCGDTFEGQS